MLVFQGLNRRFVFLHHFFFHGFVLLVKDKCLLLVDGQVFKLARDFISDSDNVLRVEKLVLKELSLLMLGHGSNVAAMEAASSRAGSFQIA